MEIIGSRLTALENRVARLEGKLSAIQRRLDDEAMERLDINALFERLSNLENSVFGDADAAQAAVIQSTTP